MAESAAGGLLDSAHPVAALSYIFLIQNKSLFFQQVAPGRQAQSDCIRCVYPSYNNIEFYYKPEVKGL